MGVLESELSGQALWQAPLAAEPYSRPQILPEGFKKKKKKTQAEPHFLATLLSQFSILSLSINYC